MAGGSVIIDPQDPLPEGRWIYRRIFIWAIVMASCAGIGWIIYQTDDPATLGNIAKLLVGLIALLSTYYLIAPSAEHIVRLVQGAAVRKADVVERASEHIGRHYRRDDDERGM